MAHLSSLFCRDASFYPDFLVSATYKAGFVAQTGNLRGSATYRAIFVAGSKGARRNDRGAEEGIAADGTLAHNPLSANYLQKPRAIKREHKLQRKH